jgi:hypothetical protein
MVTIQLIRSSRIAGGSPPLLMERVGERRIKIRQKALFDPLILTFSLREKGLSLLNLMAVARSLHSGCRVFRGSVDFLG